MPNAPFKPTLYDLSVEGLLIQELLTENEGELTPELEQRLDALMLAGPERVEAAAMVVRGLEANSDACAAEATRLANRANSFRKSADDLKTRIAIVLDCAFGGKIKTDKFTLWTQQAPDHVAFEMGEGHTIDEIEQADPSLVHVKKELNKIALKERFKSGAALPPAIAFTVNAGKRYARIK